MDIDKDELEVVLLAVVLLLVLLTSWLVVVEVISFDASFLVADSSEVDDDLAFAEVAAEAECQLVNS